MKQGLAHEALLRGAGLEVLGPWAWGDPTVPDRPGVYVISVERPADVQIVSPCKGIAFDEQMTAARNLWCGDQSIVYIGRASVSLRKRLKQFFAHTYGKRSPHAGGQSILLIDQPLVIHAGLADDVAAAEHSLISAFDVACRRKPFGNKVRAAMKKDTVPLG